MMNYLQQGGGRKGKKLIKLAILILSSHETQITTQQMVLQTQPHEVHFQKTMIINFQVSLATQHTNPTTNTTIFCTTSFLFVFPSFTFSFFKLWTCYEWDSNTPVFY